MGRQETHNELARHATDALTPMITPIYVLNLHYPHVKIPFLQNGPFLAEPTSGVTCRRDFRMQITNRSVSALTADCFAITPYDLGIVTDSGLAN